MVEVAEIFRLHGAQYRAKYGHRMLRSHLRAMRDIESCRTASLGGEVYVCKKCDLYRYSYHSCKNRHCQKCQNGQANEWIEEQKNLLLPVPLHGDLHAAQRVASRCAEQSEDGVQHSVSSVIPGVTEAGSGP